MSSNDCQTVRPLLERMVDGALEGTERTQVELHAQSCAACSGEMRAIERIGQALRDDVETAWSAVDSSQLWMNVMRGVQAPEQKPLWTRIAGLLLGSAPRKFATGLAGLAVAALTAVLLLPGSKPAVVADEPSMASHESYVDSLASLDGPATIVETPNSTIIMIQEPDSPEEG